MKKTQPQNSSHLRETTPHGNAMFPLMLYDISPDQSFDEISVIVTKSGFNNISYYNRTFRRYMNMTPSEYRRSCVGKETG